MNRKIIDGDRHLLSPRERCDECEAHFARVREGLDALGIVYELDDFQVRSCRALEAGAGRRPDLGLTAGHTLA